MGKIQLTMAWHHTHHTHDSAMTLQGLHLVNREEEEKYSEGNIRCGISITLERSFTPKFSTNSFGLEMTSSTKIQ